MIPRVVVVAGLGFGGESRGDEARMRLRPTGYRLASQRCGADPDARCRAGPRRGTEVRSICPGVQSEARARSEGWQSGGERRGEFRQCPIVWNWRALAHCLTGGSGGEQVSHVLRLHLPKIDLHFLRTLPYISGNDVRGDPRLNEGIRGPELLCIGQHLIDRAKAGSAALHLHDGVAPTAGPEDEIRPTPSHAALGRDTLPPTFASEQLWVCFDDVFEI